MTGWASDLCRPSAMRRATTSDGPPAGKPWKIVMVRDGHSCAYPFAEARLATPASPPTTARRVIFLVMALPQICCRRSPEFAPRARSQQLPSFASGHERQPLEPMHILLVLQERS